MTTRQPILPALREVAADEVNRQRPGDTATADGVWDAVDCEVSWPHDLGV